MGFQFVKPKPLEHNLKIPMHLGKRIFNVRVQRNITIMFLMTLMFQLFFLEL